MSKRSRAKNRKCRFLTFFTLLSSHWGWRGGAKYFYLQLRGRISFYKSKIFCMPAEGGQHFFVCTKGGRKNDDCRSPIDGLLPVKKNDSSPDVGAWCIITARLWVKVRWYAISFILVGNRFKMTRSLSNGCIVSLVCYEKVWQLATPSKITCMQNARGSNLQKSNDQEKFWI